MRNARLFLGFLLSLLILSATTPVLAAVPSTCLPTLPTTPGTPSFTLRGVYFSDVTDFTFWRQPCQDGSGQVAVLVRATPVTQGPLLCSSQFLILQGGVQRSIWLAVSTSGTSSFCNDLFVPTTFVLAEAFGQEPYVEEHALTVVWNANPIAQLEIPAAGPQPPTPPGVQVVITGCPCRPGTLSTIKLVYTNPGPAQTIDLRFGAHFPDGSGLAVLDDFLALPAGASEAVLLQGPIPSTPTGTYHLEAALLDPIFGVTLSRHSAALQIVP